MVRPLIGTLARRAGLVPTAMMMRSSPRSVVSRPRVRHAHVVRVDEAGDPVEHLDAVARELRLGHIDFGFDHRLHPEGQVGHGDLFLYPVVHAIDGR